MSFELLLGQHELRRAITGALHDGSMSHAILLTGAPGSGKKSWGRALAQVLLCSKNIAAESCLQCDSCRRFSSGNHPDYYLLQPEGRNIKIEQIRALRSRFYLQGTTKVCMIEKAEMMTAESCSSLLKILEDPPSELYFILLSEQPRLLFSTIVSRCQRYHLHPMDTADLKALLLRENEMNPEKAAFLARLSGGFPGQALDLASDVSFENRYQEAQTLAIGLATGKVAARQLLEQGAALSEREDLYPFLELLCVIYRDCLIQLLSHRHELLFSARQMLPWVYDVTPGSLEETVILITETIRDLRNTNVNRRLVLEKMLILTQRRLNLCPE